MISRRSFLRAGLILAAAPAIVRAESIMPVRTAPLSPYTESHDGDGWLDTKAGTLYVKQPDGQWIPIDSVLTNLKNDRTRKKTVVFSGHLYVAGSLQDLPNLRNEEYKTFYEY